MIGIKNHLLLKERIFEKCHKCGASDCIDMYVFQKYAHVFWIPFMPTSKVGVSECTNCGERTDLQIYMPEYLLRSFMNAREKTTTPFWTFALLIIVVVIVVYFEYQDIRRELQETWDDDKIVQVEI